MGVAEIQLTRGWAMGRKPQDESTGVEIKNPDKLGGLARMTFGSFASLVMALVSVAGSGVVWVKQGDQSITLNNQAQRIISLEQGLRDCQTHLGMFATTLESNAAEMEALMPLIKPAEVKRRIEDNAKRQKEAARQIRDLMKKTSSTDAYADSDYVPPPPVRTHNE